MLLLANELELRSWHTRHLAGRSVRLSASDGPSAIDIRPRAAGPSAPEPAGWAMVGDAAIVPVHGPMCKDEDWIADLFGEAYTCVSKFEAAMDAACDAVGPGGDIVLDIDSPGGTVRGEADFLEIVADARQRGVKVTAYGHDLMCSAAYLLASQCDKVYCGEQARVGSIGTVVPVYDTSELYKAMGVKVHVVASDVAKGIGIDGAPVTEEQIKVVKQQIDEITAWFVEHVSSGRNLSLASVQAMATGEVWMGSRAVEMGLCDRVVGFRELLRAMRG